MNARPKRAYKLGFREGLRGILGMTSFRAAPPIVQKHVGSPATDQAERYHDVRRFRGDVRRGRRVVGLK